MSHAERFMLSHCTLDEPGLGRERTNEGLTYQRVCLVHLNFSAWLD